MDSMRGQHGHWEKCCPLQELESVEGSGKLNDNGNLTICGLSS